MKHFFSFFTAVTLLQQSTTSQTECGTDKGKCEYGICGTSPLHCSGGCQSQFSFLTEGDGASCYRDRPSIKAQTCVSGKYEFGGDSTWFLNTEAYNGDYKAADFTIDNEFVDNFEKGADSAKLWLRPPESRDATQVGKGVRVSSTTYLNYGIFTVKLSAGKASGMVTSFISMSDDKDEIDWEWTGKAINDAQTNVFAKGVKDYTKGEQYPQGEDLSVVAKEYTIDWNEERILFIIDGATVRTYNKADHADVYPVEASRIQIAVWDGGADANAPGTRDWAGNAIDWAATDDSGYSGSIHSVAIQCAGDPVPTGPPVRPEGYTPPTLKSENIKIAVNGLAGSDIPPIGVPGAANGGSNTSSNGCQVSRFGKMMGVAFAVTLAGYFF